MKLRIATMVIICMIAATVIAGSATYEFDAVDVQYAAKFRASFEPMSNPTITNGDCSDFDHIQTLILGEKTTIEVGIDITLELLETTADSAVFALNGDIDDRMSIGEIRNSGTVVYGLLKTDDDSAAICLATNKEQGAENTWIRGLAPNRADIEVLYGVVNLMNGAEVAVEEEFIKVSGPSGSDRFLVNSVSWDYDDQGNLVAITSQFWSAKKLVGNEVVKDFSQPIRSIIMYRKLDRAGDITGITLQFLDGEETTQQAFWSGDLAKGFVYTAELASLDESGSAEAFATG